MRRNNLSQLIMLFLRSSTSKESRKCNCNFRILCIRVNCNSFRTGKTPKLFFLTVNHYCWKLNSSYIFLTKLIHHILIIPSTWEYRIYRTVCKTCNTWTVRIISKIRIFCEVNKILCNGYSLITTEVDSCRFIIISTIENISVRYVESCKIPWIGKRERNLTLLKHLIKTLYIILCENSLIIIHKPCIGSKRNAVNTILIGYRIKNSRTVGCLDLIKNFSTELWNSFSCLKCNHMIIGIHINICCRCRILSYFCSCVTLWANTVFKCNLPLRMSLCEIITHLAEPVSAFFGLVFLWAPYC